MNEESFKLAIDSLRDGAIFLPSPVARLNEYFCGCGDPEASWAWIHEYLARCVRDCYISDLGPAGQIVGYLLNFLGLTEHGATINGSWPTSDGMVLFGFLCRWGVGWEESAWWVDAAGTTHHMPT